MEYDENSLQNKLIDVFNESQYLKNSKKCIEKFMKIYKFWFKHNDKFMNVFIKIIEVTLKCDNSSPYTKRTLDFLALILKQMITFEDECELKRQEEIASRLSRNESIDEDDEEDIDSDEFDEIGQRCFDPNQTIIDKRYLSLPSSTDLFIRNFLLKYIQDDLVAVRRNSLLLLKKIIDCFDELSEDTFDEMIKILSKRSFDKDKNVRALIMLCLATLQNIKENLNDSTSNGDDEAVRLLEFHLQYDPDSFVRSCAMKCIMLTKTTLKTIFESINDPSLTIRRLAYIKIAENCSIYNLQSSDRLKLLKSGFTDPCVQVQNIIIKKFMPNWLSDIENNDLVKLVDLLNLDINNDDDYELFGKLFDEYFNSLLKNIEQEDITKFHRLVFDFKLKHLIIDDNVSDGNDKNDKNQRLPTSISSKTLPKHNCIYLWYRLCLFCKHNNVTYKKIIQNNDNDNVVGNEMNDNDDPTTAIMNVENNVDNDSNMILIDLLDEIFPDLPLYCQYIENFIKNVIDEYNQLKMMMEKDKLNDKIIKKLQHKLKEMNFTFKYLLYIGQLYEINDRAQWNHIERTFRAIILNEDLYETFNDYIESIYVIFVNYYKNDWKNLLELTMDLINTINLPELQWDNRKQTNDNTEQLQTFVPSSQLNPEERIETDVQILERCINICNSFLYTNKSKIDNNELSNNVRGLMNKLILKNLTHPENERIRLLAIKALGNYSVQSISTINHFLKVFLEILDEENMLESRVISLKCLFDFIGIYGVRRIRFIDLVNDETNDTNLSEKNLSNDDDRDELNAMDTDNDDRINQSNNQNFFEYFTDLLMKFLAEPKALPDRKRKKLRIEYELFEISVRGICKLHFIGRFLSTDFLAKLIIIYLTYKKITIELKQFIRKFLQLYSLKISNYMKIFKTTMNPFVDVYSDCFLSLLNDEQNNDNLSSHSSETLIDIFDSLVIDVNDRKNLLFKALEVFTLTNEKEFIFMNLKLITRIIDYEQLKQRTTLMEILKQFEQYRKQYFNRHKYDDRNLMMRSKDKSIKLFDRIIQQLSDRLKNFNTNDGGNIDDSRIVQQRRQSSDMDDENFEVDN